MESQVKWDMYREERSQTEEERREEAWHSGTAISADFCWILSATLGPKLLDFYVGFFQGGGVERQ